MKLSKGRSYLFQKVFVWLINTCRHIMLCFCPPKRSLGTGRTCWVEIYSGTCLTQLFYFTSPPDLHSRRVSFNYSVFPLAMLLPIWQFGVSITHHLEYLQHWCGSPAKLLVFSLLLRMLLKSSNFSRIFFLMILAYAIYVKLDVMHSTTQFAN